MAKIRKSRKDKKQATYKDNMPDQNNDMTILVIP